MSKISDMIGQKYGRWLIISRDTSNNRNIIAKCECGTLKSVDNINIRKGISKSCGCLSVELTKEREKSHGKCRTKEWNIWQSMKNRAHYYTSSHSHYYENAGITVCPKWVKSFEAFFADMGLCPAGLTLERIDNTKSYYKENCKWDTPSRQCSNRRVSTNTSSRIGVYYDTYVDKWRVCIVVDKITRDGGRFHSFNDAVEKVRELELKYLGYTRDEGFL